MMRTRSLDLFRGITVALMILVNNPGSWQHIYAPFEHAKWHGYTLTDLVFPFFLFAVGNALAIVMPKYKDFGRADLMNKVIRRTFLIFIIGFLLNWLPFFIWRGDELIFKSWTWVDLQGQEQGLRIFGVLQRVALSYGIASFIVISWEKRVVACALFILFLAALLAQSFGSLPDPWSLEGYYGTAIDRTFFGSVHLYHGEGVPFDPEGLMSTLGSISQVLFGYWAGKKMVSLSHQKRDERRKVLFQLFGWGMLIFIGGYACSCVEPINKKIWTSSYTLVTTGWAVFFLTWLEFKKWTCSFFEGFGKNALFIYCLSIFIPRFLGLIRLEGGQVADGKIRYLTPFNWYYENVCALIHGSPKNGSLAYAISLVIFYGLIAHVLDRKKIYIRV